MVERFGDRVQDCAHDNHKADDGDTPVAEDPMKDTEQPDQPVNDPLGGAPVGAAAVEGGEGQTVIDIRCGVIGRVENFALLGAEKSGEIDLLGLTGGDGLGVGGEINRDQPIIGVAGGIDRAGADVFDLRGVLRAYQGVEIDAAGTEPDKTVVLAVAGQIELGRFFVERPTDMRLNLQFVVNLIRSQNLPVVHRQQFAQRRDRPVEFIRDIQRLISQIFRPLFNFHFVTKAGVIAAGERECFI